LQVLHEMSSVDLQPQWITAYRSLPQPQPRSLYLLASGELSTTPEAGEASAQDYLYPLLSSSTNPLPGSTAVLDALWRLPAPRAGRLVWTTPALAQDVQLLGSASLDIWLSSTARDTDLQATLSEVRPDGQEVFVARGWLRASKRALDRTRSTATRPFHDFRQASVENLAPGEPTLLRLEIFPFAHRFRAGSALRVIVDTPLALTGDWGGLFYPIPAVNTVWQGGGYDSKLVVGVMPDDQPRPDALSCAELLNQPCRDSIEPVPAGRLAIDTQAASAQSALH
jgi:predicted acyl esterase